MLRRAAITIGQAHCGGRGICGRHFVFLTLLFCTAHGCYTEDPKVEQCVMEALEAVAGSEGYALGESPHVTEVSIGGKGNDDTLSSLQALPDLVSLRIYSSEVTDAGLVSLMHFPSLRTLHVSSSRVTGQALAHLQYVPELRELWLHRVGPIGPGLRHLAALEHLEELSLAESVSDEELSHLPMLPRLKKLDVGYSRITDAGLTALERVPALEFLRLSITRVTGEGLKHFRGGGLKELWLSENSLSSRGISEIGRLHELKRLRLNGSSLENIDTEPLASLVNLVELDMRATGIKDESLTPLNNMRNLETLWLSDNEYITGAGLKYLGVLPRLRFLALGRTSLGAGETTHLGQLMPLKQLQLSATSIDDEDLRPLAGLENLWYLELNFNEGITGTGLSSLSALPRLRALHLLCTSVDDDALKHLEKFPALEFVQLRGTRVTDHGIEFLKRVRPSLKIGHGPVPKEIWECAQPAESALR